MVIVYFIWVNEQKDYMAIINGQLADIVASGILSNSRIHVVISCARPQLSGHIEASVSAALKDADFRIEFHEENLYEYYGINKLWTLAQAEPGKAYLYLHAKGMSDAYTNWTSRHRYEVFLTNRTLGFHREAMGLFESNPNIQKIGMFPSAFRADRDFIWLNFFYASGRYLMTCEKPKISADRYYYETWSGTGNSNPDAGVYSIHGRDYQKYSLDEVRDILNREADRA